MRVIRAWSAVATALVSAVVGDVSTEALSNRGLLGAGSIRDTQHEALRPVAIVAALVVLGLAIFAMIQRVRARDVAKFERMPTRSVVLYGAATLVVTFLVVLLMEGYETCFGGDAPIDPHSVFVAHAPFVLAAYAVTTLFMKRVVYVCLGITVAAGHAAAAVIISFICVDRRRVTKLPGEIALWAQPSRYRALDLAYGIHGFRAPPAVAEVHAFSSR